MTLAPQESPDRVVRIDASHGRPATSRASAARAVVIGNFDGVHRGHQAVLGEARVLAGARGLETLVLTFDPHPATVLSPVLPATLTTIPRRAALLLEHVDRVTVRTFDAEFAATSPESFAKDLLSNALGAKLVVVGEDFRFGHKRAGDLGRLRALGEGLGFEVVAHALAGDEVGRFSSSRARNAVTAGEVDVARRVLGRPHSVSGIVSRGAGRGRTIDVPTANLADTEELLPARGVYAVRVDRVTSRPGALMETLEPLGGGVLNHGVRPTVQSGLAPSVEAHVFDFDGDLYGQSLRVHLIAKIREEKKFASLDELKGQIAKDAALARQRLASSE